jgi:hypothetical protein
MSRIALIERDAAAAELIRTARAKGYVFRPAFDDQILGASRKHTTPALSAATQLNRRQPNP